MSFKGAPPRATASRSPTSKGHHARQARRRDAVVGIFINKSTDVVMDTVRASGTTDPVHTSEMAYGLYPVACDNVLVTSNKGHRHARRGHSRRPVAEHPRRQQRRLQRRRRRDRRTSAQRHRRGTTTSTRTPAASSCSRCPAPYRFADNNGFAIVYATRSSTSNQAGRRQRDRLRAPPCPGHRRDGLVSQNAGVTGKHDLNHLTTGILAISQSTDRLRPGHLRPLRGFYAARNVAD